MKLAVIDLGTNTSNLLIAEAKESNFKILHQSKLPVRLGDGKIHKNEISAEAAHRALGSLHAHKTIIDQFNVDKVRVLATSAVRSAENKIAFLEQLSESSGWVVEVVSGEKEADLIFKGVLLAAEKFEKPSAILDIGGGSNEVIVARGKKMLWKESRPTGMARIINRFPISDPIRPEEIKTLLLYFLEMHKNAFEKFKSEDVKTLIGCSGAFDTIADIIDSVNPGEKQRVTQSILLNNFWAVYETLIKSTREERLAIKGMDRVRLDLIVPAMILIGQFIQEAGIAEITQTDFALREGVLFEEMNGGLGLS